MFLEKTDVDEILFKFSFDESLTYLVDNFCSFGYSLGADLLFALSSIMERQEAAYENFIKYGGIEVYERIVRVST